MSLRVVGVGCEDRGDDGVGVMVARRVQALAAREVAVGEVADDCCRLIDLLLGRGEVMIVDALAGDAPPGTRLMLNEDDVRDPTPPVNHELPVGMAVALARGLGAYPSVRVCGIVGRAFDLGAAMTPEVARAGEELAVEIAAGGVVPSVSQSSHARALPRRAP